MRGSIGLKGMKVRQQIAEFLRIQRLRRHQVAAVKKGGGHAVVIGRRAGRQAGLLVEAEQCGPVSRLIHSVIVATKAICLKHSVPTRLLRIQLL